MSSKSQHETARIKHRLFADSDYRSIIDSNRNSDYTLSGYLADLLRAIPLTKSSIIAASRINTAYGYQIFSGLRNPSRDKVLCLALAMNLSLTQTQDLLYSAGLSGLYAKQRRDALILWGFDKGKTLDEVNDLLSASGEAILTHN